MVLANEGFIKGSIIVAPNPTKDAVTINFDRLQEKVIITLYNVLGQVVSGKIVTGIETINYTITGNSGLYFLLVENQNGEKKIIKVVKE